jgi:NIPSNAP
LHNHHWLLRPVPTRPAPIATSPYCVQPAIGHIVDENTACRTCQSRAAQREAREAVLAEHYDVTIIAVRPGTHPQALANLAKTLAGDPALLACWYSDIGAVNQIMLIRKIGNEAAALESRLAALKSQNPFGVGEFITGMALDTYVPFDFMPPLQPGTFGPCYEVRTYMLKPGGLEPTIELWRKAVPGRLKVSPLLAAMSAVSGPSTRFLHVWPYRSFDERARLREKAVADGVWPPPGGPGHLISQQVDIYLPAAFSPMK